MRKRILSSLPGAIRAACLFLIAAVLVLPIIACAIPKADAAAVITEPVNLSNPRKNMAGNGYQWMNLENTLTLSGLRIETDGEYGMRIPSDATVILEGDNYISAESFALGCPGNVTFKGNGTLTLVARDTGLYFYSTDEATTVRILGGNYHITSGDVGIRALAATVSVTGGKFTIDAPNADGYAISGRNVKLYGGKITANNTVTALNLEIRNADISLEAPKAAFLATKKLTFHDVSFQVGAEKASLKKADSYNGENCVALKASANIWGESVLFGAGVPMFVDILIVAAMAALVAMGVGLPLWRAHRRSKRALAAASEAEAAERSEKKAKKSKAE